jgi:hypothetical protein
LQVFCKLEKPVENHYAAFARRRSGVRIPSAPLNKSAYLQVEQRSAKDFISLLEPFVHQ